MTSHTPPPDPLYNEIVSTTQRLFQVRPPYEWQIQIIRDLVLSHWSNHKENMLVVRPRGKHLFIRLLVTWWKVLLYFFHHYLQTNKLRKTTRHHLDFVSLHLDDMEPTSIKEIADDLTSWKEPKRIRLCNLCSTVCVGTAACQKKGCSNYEHIIG